MTAPPLYLLLAAARAELAAETPTALHTHHAPKLLDADGATSHYPDEGGVGLPFTAAFHRLLSVRERPKQTEFLMRGSLDEVNEWCRINHPNHGVEELGAQWLCGEIITLAVRWSWGTQEIAVHVLYPEPAVRSLLIGALQHAAGWRQARSTARRPTAADVVIAEVDRRRAWREAAG